MAVKKDNLPLSLRKDDDSTGTITYANEVIAIIAGVAANEVEGIAGMCTSGGITEVFGRNRNITKGVKVEIGSEEASVDLYVVVEYGTPIQTAALNVQENVRKAIETMTGLHVVRVDVHVQGVSFEKEQKEQQAGLEYAELGKVTAGAEPQPEKPEAPAETPEETPLETTEEPPAGTENIRPPRGGKRKPKDAAEQATTEEPEASPEPEEAAGSETETAEGESETKAEPEPEA